MMDRVTKLGAVWLLGVGLFLLGLTVYSFAWILETCSEPEADEFSCGVSGYLGVLSVVVAALHATAAVGAWRGRAWGAALGAVIASIGLAVCLGLREYWSWWFVLPVAAGYFGTLVVLVSALVARWRERAGHAVQP